LLTLAWLLSVVKSLLALPRCSTVNCSNAATVVSIDHQSLIALKLFTKLRVHRAHRNALSQAFGRLRGGARVDLVAGQALLNEEPVLLDEIYDCLFGFMSICLGIVNLLRQVLDRCLESRIVIHSRVLAGHAR